MSSATIGFRKEISQSLGLKKIFLDTEKTYLVEPDTIVRYPVGSGHMQGRVLVILEPYLTICINEKTQTGMIIFKEDWDKLEVIQCSQFMENPSVVCV